MRRNNGIHTYCMIRTPCKLRRIKILIALSWLTAMRNSVLKQASKLIFETFVDGLGFAYAVGTLMGSRLIDQSDYTLHPLAQLSALGVSASLWPKPKFNGETSSRKRLTGSPGRVQSKVIQSILQNFVTTYGRMPTFNLSTNFGDFTM